MPIYNHHNNKQKIPTGTVGKVTTNALSRKPNADITIRTDDACFGHIMSSLPGKGRYLDELISEWRKLRLPFQIDCIKTVKWLEGKEVLLNKAELSKKLLNDAHVRGITFQTTASIYKPNEFAEV